MSDNVETLDMITTLDLPPDRILEAAKGKLERVVIVGYDHEGNEYFASSFSDGGEVMWLMERAKLKLMRLADE